MSTHHAPKRPLACPCVGSQWPWTRYSSVSLAATILFSRSASDSSARLAVLVRAARAVGEERVQGGAQGAARAPDPPNLVDAAEPEGPRRPLADSSADRHAGLCRCPLLPCRTQRRQPKMVTAAVALAQASIVALSQAALEPLRDVLPLPGAGGRIGAARGSAGALPERHWAGALPSAPPFGAAVAA